MTEKELFIDSTDQQNRLRVLTWMPENTAEPPVIVQICHGMVEHIERYREFAAFLCNNGIGAAGHDQLGHGKTVISAAHLGYFAEKNGDRCIVDDVEEVRKTLKKRFPNSRIILLGHSMGSFVARAYVREYGKNLSGLILMGSGEPGCAAAILGQVLSTVVRVTRGSFYRSRLLNRLVLDSNSRYFTGEKVKSWLSTDEKEVQKYKEDKLCGFFFTASAYQDFFRLIRQLSDNREAQAVPKTLPVLFISGEDDPVGSFGKGVRKVYNKYKEAGIKKTSLRLFRGMRHEVLHETGRDLVYQELLEWIEGIAK